MTNTPKRPRDPNQLAKLMVDIASGEQTDTLPVPKDEAAHAMGKKGGKARAASMTPERRAEIARKAAASRWTKNA
jgi:transcription antitermination factor NusA-like protein